MLRIPTTGFAVSRTEHNGKLEIQADWIEASVLFAADTVSRSDVVDALTENQVYSSQEFAYEWTSVLFRELERRIALLGGGTAIVLERNRLRRSHAWESRPAYAFCLALSLLPHYRSYVEKGLGKNYTLQGELFELLTEEALSRLHWMVTRVGWSRSAASSIADKVSILALALGEPAVSGAVTRWTEPDAKDAGLDLLIWKSFADGLGGRPVCLVQCASGENWVDKLHTPNVATWEKLIDFSTKPRRGMAMPFAPESDHFRRKANSDILMLLMDRHRVLFPGRDESQEFPSAALAARLIKWTGPRIALFPLDSQ